jgi:hypothetical protein
MSEKKVTCFACFKEMNCFFENDDTIDGGTSLDFIGNYGSMFDGLYGRIYICDGCIDSRIGTYFIPAGNYNIDDYRKTFSF